MRLRTRQTLKIYWRHASQYKLVIFFLFVAILAATSVEIYIPFLYKDFFDTLAVNDFNLAGQLVKIIIQVLFFGFISWFFWRIATFLDALFLPRVKSDLLNTCFKYLHGHSYDFFVRSFGGALVRKVNRYQKSFDEIWDRLYWQFFSLTYRIAVILIVLYFFHWLLSLLIFIGSGFYIFFNYLFARYKLKYDLVRAEVDSQVTGHLADTVTNNINLKIFSSLEREFVTFKRLTERLYRLRRLIWNMNSAAEAVQHAIYIALEVAVLYVAIRFWQRGLLTIGDFALIQAYLIQLFVRLWDIGRHMRVLYESFADAEEMTEILMTEHEVKDIPGAKKLTVTEAKIDFGRINFTYKSGQRIFRDFSLKIKPGERVALIGPSGGGKSTLVKLLFRFYDLQGGRILINDQNVAQVTQESLRKNLSLVPQDPILFHRSLMENIRYARPSSSKEEVIKAAKLAHCNEFISKFPQGYDTYVGERGVKLSGGERQRVAIARAILKDAPILVLDEATSSLDSESEYYIQEALKDLMKGKTTIVIAHRLSTIMKMDRIVVLEKGKIIEEGTHQQLIELKQGLYQRLWEIQAGGFIGMDTISQ